MKILIIKTSSLSDIIHCIPIINDIKKNNPKAIIDWVCEPNYIPLLRAHPGINKVISIAWQVWHKKLYHYSTWQEIIKSIGNLQEETYDIVLDTQGLVKSAIITQLAKGIRWGGDHETVHEFLAGFAYQKKINLLKENLHLVEWYRKFTAKALNYSVDKSTLDYGFSLPNPLENLPDNLKKSTKSYMVIVHGASHPSKMWPMSHWKLVIRELAEKKQPMVFLWCNDYEKSNAYLLQSYADDQGYVPPNLLNTADLIRMLAHTNCVVGNETGPSHLGTALNKPTLMLFMNTHPHRSCPYTNNTYAVLGSVQEKISTPWQVIEVLNAWYAKNLI